MMMFVTIVTAVDICEDKIAPTNSCTMLTPYLDCDNYTYDMHNVNGTVMANDLNLTLVNGSIYYFIFNQSEGDYIVTLCDNSTREMIVEGEDEMASLAVMLFVMAVTFALFILPLKVNFSKNPLANKTIKRTLWIFAIFLLVLDCAMLATISEVAGLGLEDEIFRFMWFAHKAGWLFTLYTVIVLVFESVETWKMKRYTRRMGGDDE